MVKDIKSELTVTNYIPDCFDVGWGIAVVFRNVGDDVNEKVYEVHTNPDGVIVDVFAIGTRKIRVGHTKVGVACADLVKDIIGEKEFFANKSTDFKRVYVS